MDFAGSLNITLSKHVSTPWYRWSNEYLHALHQRLKWNQSSNSLAVGTLAVFIAALVVGKNCRTPPCPRSCDPRGHCANGVGLSQTVGSEALSASYRQLIILKIYLHLTSHNKRESGKSNPVVWSLYSQNWQIFFGGRNVASFYCYLCCLHQFVSILLK